MQRRNFRRLACQFKAGKAKLAPFQFVPFAALCFECLRRGDAGRLPAAFPAGAPLDKIQTVGQRISVVVAFGVAGNGKELPVAVDLDFLDDVDTRHGFHPRGPMTSGHLGGHQVL